MGRDYGGWYPPSRPRRAEGGIKARSKRGGFGGSWWARRWIQVLESFPIGARLRRGRSYARKGQVLSIRVDPGRVTASVQGSRVRPYAVVIRMEPLSEEEWEAVADRIRAEARFAARLLAGEMPEELESLFGELGLALFPRRHADLATRCSCPDWSNRSELSERRSASAHPCKHVAAVYYLLAEEFDRDPFLLLALRGLDRDGLVRRLGEAGPAAGAAAAAGAGGEPPEPLPAEPEVFWGTAPGGEGPELEAFQGVASLGGDPGEDVPPAEVGIPETPASLPRSLGGFPFWQGERPLPPFLEETYAAAARLGLSVFLGEAGAPGAEEGAGDGNETEGEEAKPGAASRD